MKRPRLIGEAMDDWIESFNDRLLVNRRISNLFDVVKTKSFRRWDALREIHALMEMHELKQHPFNWNCVLTPIEQSMWDSLLHVGVSGFKVQYPIGRYFADFACPEKMVVIECDGAAYHDEQKDALRDKDMESMGWTVYRVTGRVCNKHLYLDECEEGVGSSVTEFVLNLKKKHFSSLGSV